ncbi:MAG: mycofactocin biosynthesis glycosyltransferase MftF [Rhodospirillales bacterium]|nr:mycofactocin biosynthesis glycosyltransferase MftF [Rhodospirillales bacterium]
MIEAGARVAEPSATAASGALVNLCAADGARYALQPNLELVADRTHAQVGSGVLFSARPLLAMRLSALAFSLLSALGQGSTATEVARRVPGVSAREAATFLDSLVCRRLLIRTPAALVRWPRVTIIVAARNRPAASRRCVESLLAIDYPGEREILVVDDASEPPLRTVLGDLPIRLLRCARNIGPSAARNRAAAEAEGELVAFIDNDCEADPAWLRVLVPHFADPRIGIVGGRVIAPPPDGRIAAFETVRSPLDMGPNAGPVGPNEAIAYLPTCNLIVRSDILLAERGFASEMQLGEDVDFIWRVLERGHSAWYEPQGRIVHHHRDRLGALLARRADYASSEADLQCRHRQNRRTLRLPRVSLLALATVTIALVSPPLALAGTMLIAAIVAFEVRAKWSRLRGMGLLVSLGDVGAALLREHGAALYHLSASTVRYEGLILLAAGLVVPALLPAIAVLLLTAPVIDYRRLRPPLAPSTFVGLYWLEMAAYQLGVWRGCLRRRTLRPFLPRVRWER